MKDKIEALKKKQSYTVSDLRSIMEILRSPDGCPWDKEQTHKTIRRNLIEETYEVVEAIDKDDPILMCEELGDLLLQVIFHSQIASDSGRFTFDDVADGICKKLIHRHPHIFSDIVAETTEQVLTNWDNIKKVEKNQKSDREVLDSVSHSLPALIRADKIASKSIKLGYEVKTDDIASLADEISELDKASDDSDIKIGELLFKTAALSKKLGIDAEKALSDACDRAVERADK
jgi:tetrapyrrole methylase family protein/MazG family protein